MLADGAHTFQVRATDPSNNTDPTPASRAFTVDTSVPDTDPPETTIDSGLTGLTNDRTPTFTFSADEPGSTFQCRVDSASFGACTSPFTTSQMGDGPHTFQARATDPANNTDPTPTSRSFTVDATPPNTTIVSGPSGPTTDATPTFAFSSNEGGASFECRIDSGAFAPCSSPRTTGTLSNGFHTFGVRATDQAGNSDPSPASRRFKVDTRRPTASMTGPTTTLAFALDLPLVWTGGDPGGSGMRDYTVQVEKARWDQRFGAYQNIPGMVHVTGSQGSFRGAFGFTYCFRVQSRDMAGNLSAWSGERCTQIPADDRQMTASGSWLRKSGQPTFGGTLSISSAKGSTLRLGNARAKVVGIMFRSCTGCGAVGVWFGSTYLGWIDTQRGARPVVGDRQAVRDDPDRGHHVQGAVLRQARPDRRADLERSHPRLGLRAGGSAGRPSVTRVPSAHGPPGRARTAPPPFNPCARRARVDSSRFPLHARPPVARVGVDLGSRGVRGRFPQAERPLEAPAHHSNIGP